MPSSPPCSRSTQLFPWDSFFYLGKLPWFSYLLLSYYYDPGMFIFCWLLDESMAAKMASRVSYLVYYYCIECFHSRGQHLCKYVRPKENVCIRKEFNSQRTGLGHQHGRRFIVLGHQYGRRDVM